MATQIKGVRVETYGGACWSEKSIVVVVPDLLDEAADKILDLKIQIHQQYPTADLHVRVTEFDDKKPAAAYPAALS